jgi:pimeloyl-ACP methyl ester carboxylesterase
MIDPLNFADLNNGISRTATHILSAVQKTIAAYGATQVTIVGHSLGAFILGIGFVK